MASQIERKAQTKSALIVAAYENFGATGYQKTTIDQIVGQANLTKGAFYHHFKSKADIFEHVHRHQAKELARKVKGTLQTQGNIFKIVRVALEQFFDECRDRNIVRILLEDGPKVLGNELWREIDHEHFGYLIKGVLALGMDTGIIAKHPLDPLSNLFVSAINESVLQALKADSFDNAAKEYIDSIMVLFRGISMR